MHSIPRSVWILVGASFVVRLLFLMVVIYYLGEPALLMGDSRGYLRIAQNIVEGHGLSQSTSAPFLPDARFSPLYPMLMAGSLWVSGSLVPLVVLQIILASLILFGVYKLSAKLLSRESTKLVVLLFTGFEPLMVIFSLLVIPHVVALALLLPAAFFFLYYLEEKKWLYAFLSGGFLGLSVLVRPHAKLLIFVAVTVFAYLFLKEFSKLSTATFKKTIYSLAGFVAAFLLIISPWAARNFYHFGTMDVSSTGLRNIYTDFAVSVLSYKTGESYSEVERSLEESFAKKFAIAPGEIGTNPQWGTFLAKEGFKIIRENPKESLAVGLITLNSFFTQDLYMYFAEWFRVVPDINLDFSPSVVLVRNGPVEFFRLVWERTGAFLLIPLAGRTLWSLLAILAAVGVFLAIKKGGAERRATLFLAAIVVYFAITSLAAAFSAHGFHRYSANIFIFILAVYGSSHFAAFLKKDTRRILNT